MTTETKIFNFVQELKNEFVGIDSVELLFYDATERRVKFYDNNSNIIAGVVLKYAIKICEKYDLDYFVTIENNITIFYVYRSDV